MGSNGRLLGLMGSGGRLLGLVMGFGDILPGRIIDYGSILLDVFMGCGGIKHSFNCVVYINKINIVHFITTHT